MPMVMQPVAHHMTAATHMLPAMPVAGSKVKKAPARNKAAKKEPTRTEAVRAAKAKITRRNSLRKQRDAQKNSARP
jgi:hypothetical protein